MYLKMTGIIEFCHVYEIMYIESNKKHNHLNGILLIKEKGHKSDRWHTFYNSITIISVLT
jgi:hypothetical protein